MTARIDQAAALLKRLGWEIDHAEHVRKLALALFDQLQPLHGFGPDERDLLEAAALLHDIGWTVSGSKHHKHAYRLIREHEADLLGFTAPQVELIANIARYHRKALPKPEHEPYTALAPAEQRTVARLAALLRIADGLDRPHRRAVTEVYCGVTDRHVLLGIKALTDAGAHVEAARNKADLFEVAYGLPVEFSIVTP